MSGHDSLNSSTRSDVGVRLNHSIAGLNRSLVGSSLNRSAIEDLALETSVIEGSLDDELVDELVDLEVEPRVHLTGENRVQTSPTVLSDALSDILSDTSRGCHVVVRRSVASRRPAPPSRADDPRAAPVAVARVARVRRERRDADRRAHPPRAKQRPVRRAARHLVHLLWVIHTKR